jgi:hypothetical protein
MFLHPIIFKEVGTGKEVIMYGIASPLIGHYFLDYKIQYFLGEKEVP